MKNISKILGIIAIIAIVGLTMASCAQTYEGKDDYSDKAVKLTLKSNSYEIVFDGETYSGNATSSKAAGITAYVWTSGGTGGCLVQDKKAHTFSYASPDNSVIIISVAGLTRDLLGGEIVIEDDDIELIIEE